MKVTYVKLREDEYLISSNEPGFNTRFVLLKDGKAHPSIETEEGAIMNIVHEFLLKFASDSNHKLNRMTLKAQELELYTDLKDLCPDWFSFDFMREADKKDIREKALEMFFSYLFAQKTIIRDDLEALYIAFRLDEEHPISQLLAATL